jgi:hypothetical protein
LWEGPLLVVLEAGHDKLLPWLELLQEDDQLVGGVEGVGEVLGDGVEGVQVA